jgi:endo-1,4-beta-D-glucanase Y
MKKRHATRFGQILRAAAIALSLVLIAPAASQVEAPASGSAALGGGPAGSGLLASATGTTAQQTSSTSEPNLAFPHWSTYAVPVNHPRDPGDLVDDIVRYYDRWKEDHVIFFGNDWDGHPIYRIGWNPGQEYASISEAQGYGMIIAAHMAGHDPEAKQLFDGLYRFVKLHPSSGDSRFMRWHTPTEVWHHAYSAFDGDADIAYGLLLGHAQWGSTGDVDYRREARDLIRALSRELIGPRSGLPMLGDSVEVDGTVDLEDMFTVRLSDLMVHNFRAFKTATRDGRWTRAVRNGQNVVASMQSRFSDGSGLVPDWVVPPETGRPRLTNLRPAEPYTVEGNESDGKYGYNSARIPWRFGLDYLTTGDAKSGAIVSQISAWAESEADGDPYRLVDGYELDGTPYGDTFAPAFLAPLGVAALSQPDQADWTVAIYSAIRDTHQNYFNDSVALLSMLIMSGLYIDVA